MYYWFNKWWFHQPANRSIIGGPLVTSRVHCSLLHSFKLQFLSLSLSLSLSHTHAQSHFSVSLKAMDLLHKFLNIILLPLTFILLLLFMPPFLLLKFLFSLKRYIFMENVAGKVALITGASSGIGEVFIHPTPFIFLD